MKRFTLVGLLALSLALVGQHAQAGGCGNNGTFGFCTNFGFSADANTWTCCIPVPGPASYPCAPSGCVPPPCYGSLAPYYPGCNGLTPQGLVSPPGAVGYEKGANGWGYPGGYGAAPAPGYPGVAPAVPAVPGVAPVPTWPGAPAPQPNSTIPAPLPNMPTVPAPTSQVGYQYAPGYGYGYNYGYGYGGGYVPGAWRGW
jgi:hypothetical protein